MKTRSRRDREREGARAARSPNALARWLRRRAERSARRRTPDAVTHVRIPAAEFAARHGFRESAVVSRIQKGIYDGVEVDGEWHVIRRSDLGAHLAGAPSSLAGPRAERIPATFAMSRALAAVTTGLVLLGLGIAGFAMFVMASTAGWSVSGSVYAFGFGLAPISAALSTVLACTLWCGAMPAVFGMRVAFEEKPVLFSVLFGVQALAVALLWLASLAVWNVSV